MCAPGFWFCRTAEDEPDKSHCCCGERACQKDKKTNAQTGWRGPRQILAEGQHQLQEHGTAHRTDADAQQGLADKRSLSRETNCPFA
jgi:hypothetical protein